MNVAFSLPRRTRNALGTVAAGVAAAGALVVRKTLRERAEAASLPPAIDAAVEAVALREGVARYYHRPGKGRPLVLLHDLHLGASSMDVRPAFDRVAEATRRPIVALDWLGFGLSDKPDRRYMAGLYQRQLSHVVEVQSEPADVVAFGLASVYAAAVAVAAPRHFRSLLLVAPSGFSTRPEHALLERMLAGLSGGSGTYGLFYSRQSTPEAVAHHLREHQFYTGAPIPPVLLDYAVAATRAPGADHALEWLSRGVLDMHDFAARAYLALSAPTLLVLPALPDRLVRAFDRLPELVRQNPALQVRQLDSGRMPQWEDPDAFADLVLEWTKSGRGARTLRK